MKKKKKNLLTLLILFVLTIIPTITAFASLKSNTIGLKRNFVETDGTKTYEIIANLDGGKFNSGTTPEFIQKDTNNWVHNYKPIATEITLPTPIKNGYEFIGWSSDENPNINKTFIIPKWNNKNINVKANWKSSNATLITGPTFNSTINNLPGFENVTEIKFVKETPNSNGINVAIEGDAKAYIEGNILKIASAGEIFANPDSSKMFYEFGNTTNKVLNKITFENFNTNKITNMHNMFAYCNKITTLDLNNFNTSQVTNMSNMFSNCNSIINLNIENFNTSNVTNMSGMFKNCKSLTSLNISNFNTSKVNTIDFMFTDCNKLTSLNLNNWNTENINSMTYLFSKCSELTNLNINTWNVNNVTDMSYLFNDCIKLTNLDLNTWNTSKTTNMSHMFNNCNKLTTLNISNWDINQVTNTTRMFNYCSELTNLNLKNWNTNNIQYSDYMFYNCYKLNGEITIKNPNIISYATMFNNCSKEINSKFIVNYISPTTKEMARKLVNTKNTEDHVYLYEPISVKYKFNISDGSTIPTEIKNLLPIDNNTYLIYENNKVTIKNPSKTSITIGNNKYTFQSYDKTNGFTITENMLKTDSNGNKYIEIIGTWKKEQTLPIIEGNTLIPGPEFNRKLEVGQDLDAYTHMIFKKVSSMSGISGIDVSAAKNKSIIAYKEGDKYYIVSTKKILANKNASYMFNTTTTDYLTTIDLTNFDIGQAQNVEEMFSGQSGLRNIINIENMHTYHVTNMSSMFYGCYNLGSMDLSKWNTSKVTSLFGTFVGCGCPTLNVSTWDVSNVTNMRCTFMNMENLRTLDLSSWKTKNSKTFRALFDRCYNLGEVKGNIVIGTPDAAFWITKDCPNVRLKVTVTETYDDYKFSNTYSGMFDNSSQNGKITVDYTSNAKTLAQEIVNESPSRYGSPNVYLGSQVTVPYSLNTFNVFKINPNKKQINDEYKIREYLKNNNELLNKYEMGKMSEQEINEINEKINDENIINIIEDKINKLLIVKAN